MIRLHEDMQTRQLEEEEEEEVIIMTYSIRKKYINNMYECNIGNPDPHGL